MNDTNNSTRSEAHLLDAIFELDDIDENIEVPEGLHSKLYHITDPQPKRHMWKAPLAVAASVVLAATVFFGGAEYQNQRELALAKHELALAFQYVDFAQQKTEAHVTKTLKQNLQHRTLQPIFASAQTIKL